MTDFSSERSLASDLSISEATVDTAALSSLKRATLEVDSTDPTVAQ